MRVSQLARGRAGTRTRQQADALARRRAGVSGRRQWKDEQPVARPGRAETAAMTAARMAARMAARTAGAKTAAGTAAGAASRTATRGRGRQRLQDVLVEDELAQRGHDQLGTVRQYAWVWTSKACEATMPFMHAGWQKSRRLANSSASARTGQRPREKRPRAEYGWKESIACAYTGS